MGVGLAIVVARMTLREMFMHLQRVQVPNFRALKNVDITFEKEFQPRIFPLGSQNGSGKSTLLQLIFVLLHCSVDPDRKAALRNMLEDFQIHEGDDKRVLAKIDIWDGERTVELEFFSCKDDYIKCLAQESNFNIDDNFVFSISDRLESKNRRISNLKNKIGEFNNVLNRLIDINNREESELNKRRYLEYEATFGKDAWIFSTETDRSLSILDNIHRINSRIDRCKSDLDIYSKENDLLYRTLQSARKVMDLSSCIYLCQCSVRKNLDEVLVCYIKNTVIEEIEEFFTALSKKIFLQLLQLKCFFFYQRKIEGYYFKKRTMIITIKRIGMD